MTKVYLNDITTAVPPHDIHKRFTDFAPSFLAQERDRALFKRMAQRSQIEHRYSFLKPGHDSDELDGDNFYKRGDFPGTGIRMQFYEQHSFKLAQEALDKFSPTQFRDSITHILITSCTGFYAPGLDLQIVQHYGLKPETERTIVGFMGCYAAFNGLKLARHIVRSELHARVLILNLELCTLHLQETDNIEQLLSYLIFADGCAASIVSAEPRGISLDTFSSTIMSDSSEQIGWTIGGSGFDMVLSGEVPATIANAIPTVHKAILNGYAATDIHHWAIHPGGRSVLDAVQKSLRLSDVMMLPSREVLRAFGNMSSATIMFVLKDILEVASTPGRGCALAFGPGVTLESMLFRKI